MIPEDRKHQLEVLQPQPLSLEAQQLNQQELADPSQGSEGGHRLKNLGQFMHLVRATRSPKEAQDLAENHLLQARPDELKQNLQQLHERQRELERVKTLYSAGRCDRSLVEEKTEAFAEANPVRQAVEMIEAIPFITRMIIKSRVKPVWAALEPYFDPPTVLSFYVEKGADEMVAVLRTPEGMNYLNGICHAAYRAAYKLVWDSDI